MDDVHQSPSAEAGHRFARALGVFLSSRIISAASLLAIGILTARILGPEGRGHYALFFTIVGVGTNLTGLGLSQSNTYFLNRERVSAPILFGNTLLAIASVGTVSGAIISLVGTYPEVVGMQENWAFPSWLLWAAMTGALLETQVSGLVYGSHLYNFQSRSLIIQAILLLAATVLVIPVGANLSAALELRVAASLIFVGWYVWRFTSSIGLHGFAVNVDSLRAQLRFGMKNWLQNLIGILNYRGYMLLLAAFGGPEALGLFSIALLFAEAVRFIPETIGTMLLPRLVSMQPGAASGHLAASACRIITFGMVFIGVGLVVIADWIVPVVFGVQYTAGAVVTKVLMPGAVLGTVYQVLTRYFTSEHAQKYSLVSGIVGLIVAVTASLLLIPHYGATGASAAYSASALATCISMLWGFGRHSRRSPMEAIIPTRADWNLLSTLARAKVSQVPTIDRPGDS